MNNVYLLNKQINHHYGILSMGGHWLKLVLVLA